MQSPASPSWHIGYGSADEGSADAAAPPADAERRLSFLQRLAAVAAGGGAGIGLSPTNSGSSISEGQQEGTAAAPEKFYVRTRSSVSWLGVGEGGQRRGCVRATTVRILKGPLLQEPGTCTNPSCRKYVCPWAPMYKNNTICAACNQVRVKEEAAAKAAKAVKAGQPPPAKRQKQGWGGHRRGTAKKKAGAPRGWNAATVRAGCHAAGPPPSALVQTGPNADQPTAAAHAVAAAHPSTAGCPTSLAVAGGPAHAGDTGAAPQGRARGLGWPARPVPHPHGRARGLPRGAEERQAGGSFERRATVPKVQAQPGHCRLPGASWAPPS